MWFERERVEVRQLIELVVSHSLENLPYLLLRSCCWDLIICLQISRYSIFILRHAQHLIALVNISTDPIRINYD